jgi:penicillin-binding protein 2
MKTRALATLPLLVVFALLTNSASAVTAARKRPAAKPKAAVKKFVAGKTTTTARKTKRKPVRRRYYSPWDEPTYADSTVGDYVDGEDLIVRRAAVEALGPWNGSVVVTDPDTGRILTMVNQKVALGEGYQPCSTVKIPIAFAALSEGLIERTTMLPISRKVPGAHIDHGNRKLDLTEALAKSSNGYFASLGEQLGYERVSYYAHLFGLGEKAGLNIPGENAGRFPSGPPKNGGVGMLTSFGEEIALTPLQLSAMMGAIANGGTLYYLQHPRSKEDVATFTPRVKRRLEIESQIADVEPGMRGAVLYGTARRAYAITEDPIMGKTGTCSDRGAHLGWFGSFGEVNTRKIAVSVLLTGGRPSVGPAAAGVAGAVYKALSEQRYVAAVPQRSPGLFSQSAVGPVVAGN